MRPVATPSSSGFACDMKERRIPVPVSYTIDASTRLIRTRCYGEVTLQEVVEHFRKLREDPNLPDYLDVYLDLLQMTSIPTAEEIHEASAGPNLLRGIVIFGCCVVVADRDALFGMARMWEMLVEQSFSAIKVFRSTPAAEEWLATCRTRNESASG